MAGRLRREEKGKEIASDPFQAPRTAHIRIQDPDNAELLQRHSLTLIGRVTNRTAQRVWSLIPFFTDLWKANTKPVGSELGNGMFQFQFDNEEDLLTVLEKRPYYYGRWMVIVQRWEPTVSKNFPSLLPFWIKVQGIPVHLWTEETIQKLREDLGVFEKAEITSTTVRMRVQINGLLPLIKTSVIEYANGDEVTASFVYEKLDRHCYKCYRLDRDIKDCLEAKHEARALKAQDASMGNEEQDRRGTQPKHQVSGSNIFHFSAQTTEHRGRQDFNRRERQMDARDELEARRRSRSSRDTVSRRYLSEDPKRGREDHHSQTSRSSYHRDTNLHHHEVNSGPRDLRRDLSDRYLSRDRSLQTSRHRDSVTSAREESPPRQSRSNQNRGIPLEEIQASVPKEVFNAAVGEVREAMMQYTQCNDPTESAARRERMRRAEEEGEMEETAALMIQAKMTAPTDTVKTPEQQPSRERVPATLRLGPIAPSTQEPAPKVIKEAGKRKPGRPPSKRTVQGSPKLIRGSTSKKRKTHQDKPTATRRKLNQDSAQGNPQKSNSKPSSSRGFRGAVGRTESQSNSEDQPICNLIPASSRRRRMDFQNPSTPVP
ncbi:uncharacterized protein LOC111211769 [Brassica napus]|uniref:uncharacterized protein LOC111211769 n=1 Tax=Brassica napus TaxID=3708 RepID=UPI0006AAF027|nr:uncharacterized protein LOC111211769 [Brassica napus]